MAKPASLFLDMATVCHHICGCIIDTLADHEENSHNTPLMHYQDNLSSASILEMRVKLLFTEFDKGELFLERLRAIDAERGSAYSKERLIAYKEVLDQFIRHLNTFRI